MRNFVENGKVIHVVIAGAAVVSGQMVKIGALMGVATTDGAIGDTVAFSVQGVYNVPKLGTDVVAQGALLYWDDTNKRLTTTASGNTLVGEAWKAAGNGVANVDVRLKY